MYNKTFKNSYNFFYRYQESSKMLIKYPDRVPIICEKLQNKNDCPNLNKKKYMVPNDFTVGQFLYIIRQQLKVGPEKAIFLFVSNTIPPTSIRIINLYNLYRDDDLFLYVNYSSENTFG
jgi:GABA(A) receptor-associated protein